MTMLAVAVLAAGCSTTGSTVPLQLTNTTATVAPTEPVVPELLDGVAIETIRLDDMALLVAIADTADLRRRGLMDVADLADLDGMLFVFEQDSTVGFWMKDTLLPLDVAFFDAGGLLVDDFVMDPCPADPCPVYRPAGPYRYALEMPAGQMPAEPGPLALVPTQ